MNKITKLILGGGVALLLAFALKAGAVGPGTPNYWCLNNTSLSPCSSQWTVVASTSVPGALVANNNLSDVQSSSSALTNLGAVGLGNNNTFTGSNTFNATTTVNAYSYLQDNSNVWTIPSPTQLAAGATCGVTTGVTDALTCAQDIYNYQGVRASSTPIFVPYLYQASGTFNANIAGSYVYMFGIPGTGAGFNYTPATGTVITINDGVNCLGANKPLATQLQHISLTATTATTTNGGVTLLYVGGTNGGCGTNVDDVNLSSATYGLQTGSSTYMFTLSNSSIWNVWRAIFQHYPSNSAEGMDYISDKITSPAGPNIGGTSSSSNYIYLDDGSSPSTVFLGGSWDQAGAYIGVNNLMVLVQDVHLEDSGVAADGVYDRLYATSSAQTHVVMSGDSFIENATSSNGGPVTELVTCGANCDFDYNTVWRNTNGTSSQKFVQSLGGVSIESFNNNLNTDSSGNPTGFVKLGPLGSVATNNGTVYSYKGDYIAGWDYSGALNQSVFYGANNGPDETVSGNLGGVGTNVSNYFSSAGVQKTGTSTVDVGGTFGTAMTVTNFSSTIAQYGQTNTYVYTGATAVPGVFTLPFAASTSNRQYNFVDEATGLGSLQITVTSTDHIVATSSQTTFYMTTSSVPLQLQSDGNGHWYWF